MNTISRRVLLGGTVAGLLAGCSAGASTSTAPGSTTPGGEAFFVAHRGGGGDWPEMTQYAYQQAATLPQLTAMEVSVRRAQDGTLVCQHDPDTSRLGSRHLVVARSTWPELSQVQVSARETRDPSQPSRPLARFEEVLAAWPHGMTLWVEPKADDTVAPLFALLSRHVDLDVVWKRPVNAPDFQRATEQGWRTFGYVLDGEQQMGFLRSAAPYRHLTYLGVSKTATDERVRQVVSAVGTYGREVVMWPLQTVAERDRAIRLGCRGLMCSEIQGLLAAPLPG